jgi:hypothetical protein
MLQRPKGGGDVVWDTTGVYPHNGVYHPPENSCGNSGTTEPAASTVVPRFPQPRILEGIIRKNAEPGRNYRTITDGNE